MRFASTSDFRNKSFPTIIPPASFLPPTEMSNMILGSRLDSASLATVGPRFSSVRSRLSLKVQTRAAAESRPHWLPGTDFPKHLNGSLPGDYGFDPLKLGENKEALEWYQQAELQNGRWAMLGVFGILFHNLLGKAGLGGPAATTTTWFDAGKFNYGVDNRTLLAIEFFLFAWVEARRYQDLQKPGSANVDPVFNNNKLPEQNEPGYPGGIFDPLGFTKGKNLEELKTKEIKNARLAMLAFAGFLAQAWTTKESPLDNLTAHLSDPWTQNVFARDIARL